MTTKKYSQTSGVPLSVAVFLATDHYDHNDDPYTISATTLIKPLRQIILPLRLKEETVDLLAMFRSRVGTAIHTGIETAWENHHAAAFAALGLPSHVAKAVRINPTPEEAKNPDIIPVYMEQRLTRKVGKWTVSGKFDFIMQGRLEDFKSTSAFTVKSGINESKFKKQGSVYRWMGSDIITNDNMAIQYLITDWSRAMASQDETYPKAPVIERIIPLEPIQETNNWITIKLQKIEEFMDAPEADIPHCTDEDLQMSEPMYKYYSDPAKAEAKGRSTKNFTSPIEAYKHLAEKGKGVVKEVPGEATFCRICPAFQLCHQKDLLVEQGRLTL